MKQSGPQAQAPGPATQSAPRANVAQPRIASPGAGPPEESTGGLLEYYRIIQRRRGAVIVITCLGMLAGFLYTLPQTPIYQARAVIELQSLNEDFMHMRDVTPTSSGSAGGYMPDSELPTQVRILQSRALLERVIQRLGLENKDLETHPTRLDAWRKVLKLAPVQTPAREAMIQQAAGGLRVRAQTNTRLIEILCDSTNPQMAADFANTLVAEYKEHNLEARWQTTQDTGDWLAKQMQDVRIKLEKSDEELQSYASGAGLLFTEEKDNAADERVKQLQQQLSAAEGERINRQSRYELASTAAPTSLGEILDDGSLRGIQDKLTDLQRQLAQLSVTYTPSNPKVQMVQDQIAPLETALQEARANTLARIRNDYEAAQQREKLLQADYDAAVRLVTEQADEVNHYNILKREVDTDRGLYDSMLQSVKSAGIASALRASNINIVDPATAPGAPYRPSVRDNTLLGAFLGFAFGVGFVILLDRADRTIQEPTEVSTFLGIPELGIVPSASLDWLQPRSFAHFGAKGGAATPDSVALIASGSRRSAMAESFHDAITSILYASAEGNHPRVLVLSSPGPKEGKTTIATNLAIAFAQIRRRVLLVDCDLRRPRMHHIFGLDNDSGVVDLLRSVEPLVGPLNGLIHKTSVPNLSVMTAGRADSGDPTMLHLQRFGEIVKACRDQFDLVLIDTPPMLTMADARVTARHSDGVVLVARANQTSRYSLRDACQRLNKDGTRILGAILNDWNPKKSGLYSYYRYYDKYRHYYAKRGLQSDEKPDAG
ncbi:MAG: polysaccharide biosynthesis tyrosine autokinase [Bryobacteraceae bacterium]|jgi:capsular exopolysaccharide synthesis family protein